MVLIINSFAILSLFNRRAFCKSLDLVLSIIRGKLSSYGNDRGVFNERLSSEYGWASPLRAGMRHSVGTAQALDAPLLSVGQSRRIRVI